jgi:hypothetical protein
MSTSCAGLHRNLGETAGQGIQWRASRWQEMLTASRTGAALAHTHAAVSRTSAYVTLSLARVPNRTPNNVSRVECLHRQEIIQRLQWHQLADWIAIYLKLSGSGAEGATHFVPKSSRGLCVDTCVTPLRIRQMHGRRSAILLAF